MSKTLDRISLLLNQAENTDNEAEAAAFMSKAQGLATLAAIDLEVARQHQADKTKREVPTQKKIHVAERVGSKVQNHAPHFCNLFMTVGGVNDLKFNIAHNSMYVIAFGMPSDIEVTEALYGSLVVQMKSAADIAIARGDHKQERVAKYNRWGEYEGVKAVDARVYRASFYTAFTSAVLRRLTEAKAEASSGTFILDVEDETGQVEHVETSGALVLIEKGVEIADFYRATSTARGSWAGARRAYSSGSSSGYDAGRTAGARARLGSQGAIGRGQSQVSA